MVTWGKRDVVVSESDVDSYAPRGAEVKKYALSGHVPHLDQREDYLVDLQRFLARIDSYSPSKK